MFGRSKRTYIRGDSVWAVRAHLDPAYERHNLTNVQRAVPWLQYCHLHPAHCSTMHFLQYCQRSPHKISQPSAVRYYTQKKIFKKGFLLFGHRSNLPIFLEVNLNFWKCVQIFHKYGQIWFLKIWTKFSKNSWTVPNLIQTFLIVPSNFCTFPQILKANTSKRETVPTHHYHQHFEKLSGVGSLQ